MCHGALAEGLIGPTLVGLDGDTIRAFVRTGGGVMPPFAEASLSNEVLDQIIAFLQSLE